MDTLHDEIARYPIFFLGRHIAQGCTLAIPFAVFRHMSPTGGPERRPVAKLFGGRTIYPGPGQVLSLPAKSSGDDSVGCLRGELLRIKPLTYHLYPISVFLMCGVG